MVKAGLSRTVQAICWGLDCRLKITVCNGSCLSSCTLTAVALAVLVLTRSNLCCVSVLLAAVLLVSMAALGFAFLIVLLAILGSLCRFVWH